MADLEKRVDILEKDVARLKGDSGRHQNELESIPDLLRMEFRLMASQIARLSAKVDQLTDRTNEQGAKLNELGDLPARVDALPRVVAELVVEMLKERGKKG